MLKNSSLNISVCNLIYTVSESFSLLECRSKLQLRSEFILSFKYVEFIWIKCCCKIQRISERYLRKCRGRSQTSGSSANQHTAPCVCKSAESAAAGREGRERTESSFTSPHSSITRGPHSENCVYWGAEDTGVWVLPVLPFDSVAPVTWPLSCNLFIYNEVGKKK